MAILPSCKICSLTFTVATWWTSSYRAGWIISLSLRYPRYRSPPMWPTIPTFTTKTPTTPIGSFTNAPIFVNSKRIPTMPVPKSPSPTCNPAVPIWTWSCAERSGPMPIWPRRPVDCRTASKPSGGGGARIKPRPSLAKRSADCTCPSKMSIKWADARSRRCGGTNEWSKRRNKRRLNKIWNGKSKRSCGGAVVLLLLLVVVE
mmetsp:Transcript_2089/g.4218  ORF Transcript_2089/g.4218 Transcript_2089/m.4218 type:complete len:203 (+) Transcript_2089:928-1536(+)